MQSVNTDISVRQWQFYAGQTWDQLQNGAEELAKRRAHKRPSDAERLDFIEKAARLEGGIRMAQQLVPEIRRRHHEGLERNFAHLLTALQRLEGVSGVTAEERASAQQEALAIVGLMDAGEDPTAEERMRLLEQRVEQMAAEGIDRDIESRLSVIQRLLAPVE
jgi:hypothetical protein